MKAEEIRERDQIREVERLQNVIFIEMCIRKPIVQDDDVMGSYVCYWCDEPPIAGHAPDCLWSEARKIYDIIMEE